jgi:hypothetical protein
VALGGAVSVAANVAHSFVPPVGAPADWRPMKGAVLGAVFWPMALFVAIEILARTSWPAGVAWRFVRLAGLLPVAVVAAVVSYRHLSGLIRFYGEDGLTATFGPLAVDGLMAVASAAIIASSATPPVLTVAPEQPPAPESPPEPEPSLDPEARRAALPEPSVRRPQLDAARSYVREEVEAGRTPAGAAIGRRFGRNSRWGQRIVRDVLLERSSAAEQDAIASTSQPAS